MEGQWAHSTDSAVEKREVGLGRLLGGEGKPRIQRKELRTTLWCQLVSCQEGVCVCVHTRACALSSDSISLLINEGMRAIKRC